MRKLLIGLLAVVLAMPAALAETITLDGTVVSTKTVPVVAPAAGVLYQVYVHEGEHVSAGDEAAALYAQPVYAEQAGTVKVFGTEGESVEALVSRYGAVLYIEPDCQYTVSTSTRYAYDVEENKIIHPGETVYLRCTTSGSTHEGVGRITSVSGSSYTVEITEGAFESGENVYICRSEDYATSSRIGRGTVSHVSPVAVTGLGTGRVSSIHVADGAHVEIGDALFDTVLVDTASSYAMISEVNGTVAEVLAMSGSAVSQGMVVANIYPDEAMRLEIAVSENDLRDMGVGARVTIEFTSGETAEGEIDWISSVARVSEDEEDDTVYFKAYVRFDAPETVRYGMTAKVTTVGE
ncbi:MAG: HlyD family efflux transporter periplasmic adaptor subunit [Christensenellaceae bacterium]|nr:HlyD family efflux transporter periplasmic adaptor subunit [Christensenellaceae bacterium]